MKINTIKELSLNYGILYAKNHRTELIDALAGTDNDDEDREQINNEIAELDEYILEAERYRNNIKK